MLWDFLLFMIIGPLLGLFVYCLTEDRRRSEEEYLEQLKKDSSLVY